jgi:hypothetical protein
MVLVPPDPLCWGMVADSLGAMASTRAAPAKPMAVPKTAPMMPVAADSLMIWLTIRLAGHPRALRVPSSRTRRLTAAAVSRLATAKAARRAAATHLPGPAHPRADRTLPSSGETPYYASSRLWVFSPGPARLPPDGAMDQPGYHPVVATAAVAVEDHALCWPPPGEGHRQCVLDEAGAHVVRQRPSDDLAAGQVDDRN